MQAGVIDFFQGNNLVRLGEEDNVCRHTQKWFDLLSPRLRRLRRGNASSSRIARASTNTGKTAAEGVAKPGDEPSITAIAVIYPTSS
jgi:hypothetical protein